jgi:hypothetical protein
MQSSQTPYPSWNADYSDSDRVDPRFKEQKNGWQVAKIWDRHHEVVRLKLVGMDNKEIARELQISESHVSNIVNSPVIRDKLILLQAARDVKAVDLSRDIAELSEAAMERLREAVETGKVHGKELKGSDILKEANSILDRHLGKAIQRTDNTNRTAVFSAQDLLDIKKKAEELAGSFIESPPDPDQENYN